jgi:hypothetical protein
MDGRRTRAQADETHAILALPDIIAKGKHSARRVCFITAGPITKLFAWGEEESGGHVL